MGKDTDNLVKRLRDVEWMKFGPAAWNEIQGDRDEAADMVEDLERVLADAEKGGYEQAAALAAKDAEIESIKTGLLARCDQLANHRNALQAEIARLTDVIDSMRDQIDNLKALIPHHEYTGQDK